MSEFSRNNKVRPLHDGAPQFRRRKVKSCKVYYMLRGVFLRVAIQKFQVNDQLPGQDSPSLQRLIKIGYNQKDIDRLYTIFLRIDEGKK